MTQFIDESKITYMFKPGETGINHRKYGPCSIVSRSTWNAINFYEIRVHGTTNTIQVTESQLSKEQKHEH